MNVSFETTPEGVVVSLPFPDEYRPRMVFQSRPMPTYDDAYGDLLDVMAIELAELREIIGVAQA